MISVDDPQTNKEFAESLNTTFPLLSNPEKDVARAYGVVTAERELPFRWTYISVRTAISCTLIGRSMHPRRERIW